MDALIDIDGEEWSVKADEPLSPKSQVVFDSIRRKHAARDDGAVSLIIRNNLERKRLLSQLHREGMTRWVNDGSKALFDKLVKEAVSRASAADESHESAEARHRPMKPSASADSQYVFWKWHEGAELQGSSESVILEPALLKAASIFAEPAMKSAKQKHTSYVIGGALKKYAGQRYLVVGLTGILEHESGRSVSFASKGMERRKGVNKPDEFPSDERTP
ncbi:MULTISPECIES: hypothetical protein [Pseudomonas syringae group]|uniref:hypothetical protein n=1 Tax=Pseudomonas syringae group TaxID=136849 RepID=UPI000F046B87|nr:MULTISPECIES: hypothetical protein [Pseudomonas syringae group]MBI6766690.1 hypothetical protein [Pseudomonas syringae]MBI6786209.1 hypothetical protein [Pseudomonas syringae]